MDLASVKELRNFIAIGLATGALATSLGYGTFKGVEAFRSLKKPAVVSEFEKEYSQVLNGLRANGISIRESLTANYPNSLEVVVGETPTLKILSSGKVTALIVSPEK